jgi:hypothetical protein
MREPNRCDVCRAKAELDPQTLYDVLCYLAPSVELLAALERWSRMKKLPEPVLNYMERWRKLNADDPVPEVDRLSGTAVQGTLLDGRERTR